MIVLKLSKKCVNNQMFQICKQSYAIEPMANSIKCFYEFYLAKGG